MSTHTPGPWRLHEGSIFGHAGYIGITSPAHDFLAEVVVKMDDDTERSPRLLANARLIAAAPDLLAALQRAVNVLDATGATDDANAARAAIAAATGEAA